jgi:hypothetical protein
MVVVAYAVNRYFDFDRWGDGFNLDPDKMKVTCKVKCNGGTVSTTSKYDQPSLCAKELKDGCN